MANYGINGFGRIGRNVLRAMEQSDVERIAAINDLTDTLTLAHLLKWDSVHGKFDGEIGHDAQNIIVRGHKIKVLKERDPGNLPWKGSVTDFTAILEKDATVDSINTAFKEAGASQRYKNILEYSDEPLVSIDVVGNAHSCIFDSKLAMTHGGRFVKIVGWYDNEWGYSNRCVQMLELLGE
jgi:glyceraldehyde 3-phosphate dehydrogenase